MPPATRKLEPLLPLETALAEQGAGRRERWGFGGAAEGSSREASSRERGGGADGGCGGRCGQRQPQRERRGSREAAAAARLSPWPASAAPRRASPPRPRRRGTRTRRRARACAAGAAARRCRGGAAERCCLPERFRAGRRRWTARARGGSQRRTCVQRARRKARRRARENASVGCVSLLRENPLGAWDAGTRTPAHTARFHGGPPRPWGRR